MAYGLNAYSCHPLIKMQCEQEESFTVTLDYKRTTEVLRIKTNRIRNTYKFLMKNEILNSKRIEIN